MIASRVEDDEVEIFNIPQAGFEYRLENCVVKVEDLVGDDAVPDFFDNCTPCIPEAGNAEVSLFVDPDEGDYHLDTFSIAEGFASPILNLDRDLEGNLRDASTPDAGCFEKID